MSLQFEQSSVGAACSYCMWCRWDIWRPSLPSLPSVTFLPNTSILPSLSWLSLDFLSLSLLFSIPWPLPPFLLPLSLTLVLAFHVELAVITHSLSHSRHCIMRLGTDFGSVLCLIRVSSRISIKRQAEWSQITQLSSLPFFPTPHLSALAGPQSRVNTFIFASGFHLWRTQAKINTKEMLLKTGCEDGL